MGSAHDHFTLDDSQEQKLTKLSLSLTSACAFKLSQDGNILYANSKACDSLGYSQTELLEMSVFDIDPVVDREAWPQIWQMLCDEGAVAFESEQRRKDGTFFPVEVTATLIECDNRLYAMALVKDILERNRIYESLRTTQFIVDKAPLGIFVIKDGGHIVNVNDHACRYLGYTREELCQMNVLELDQGHAPQDIEQIWLRQQQANGIDTFETVHRRKDGTDLPVEIDGILLELQGGSYSVSFVKDISERKEAEKQRVKMEARMRETQKMESLGTLAGGIAHDFNNILGAILGYAEMAQYECPADSRLEYYATQITKAGYRAKELVQQILLFSRQGSSEKGPIDVGRVVDEAFKLIKASLPANIEILANISHDLAPIFANEIHIHQIVMNLCTNAYYAMKSFGGTLNVSLTAVAIQDHDIKTFSEIQPGNYLKLSISDTGCGIPSDIINRIFDPYFTTKPIGEGTGLGLSTIHGIVKDHSGSIKVYSEVGIGTTFHIFLPTAEATAEITVEKLEQLPMGSGCILFVDDEESLLDIGRDLLSRLGYQVETRASALDALEAFQVDPQKFDLVISDITMPKMTGDEIARQIKAIRPEIPIILCSGFSDRINPQTMETIGISALLMKPIIYADLAQTVHRILKIDL
jgi:PAS domain S-box-containing protein